MRLPRSLFAAAWVMLVGALLPAGHAAAHTALDFTLPAEGTTVAEPVREISVGFTDVVALVGNGFEVLDPQGNLVVPFAVTDDDKVFRLQLDPPLAGGPVVVSYHVLSLDGHEVEGQVTFTAAAEPPAPTTTSTTTPTTTPATAPATAQPATQPPATAAATTEPSTTTQPSTTPSSATEPTATDDDSDGDSGRSLLIPGLIVVVIGSLAFVAVRSRQSP